MNSATIQKMPLSWLAEKLAKATPDEEFLEVLSREDVQALQWRVRENQSSAEFRRARFLHRVEPLLLPVLLMALLALHMASPWGLLVDVSLAIPAAASAVLGARKVLRGAAEAASVQRMLEDGLLPLRLAPEKAQAWERVVPTRRLCVEYAKSIEDQGREPLVADFYLLDKKTSGALSASEELQLRTAPRSAPVKTANRPIRTPAPSLATPPRKPPEVFEWRPSQLLR